MARVATAALVAGGIAVPALALGAGPAAADTDPVAPSSLSTVTADALPTVQINGVVWDQTIVGDTVYATGQFTSARPAGAAAGTNETPRSNLLAYSLTTGVLNTAWAPSLNAQGYSIVASPDGSTIYVGGDFTAVNGVTRNRIVALDATTGAVRTGFAASVNSGVRAIDVTSGVLYAGGTFTTAAGQARSRLAAFDAGSGALLSWAPTTDAAVLALTAPEGSGKVFVGGRFQRLNGAANYGLGLLDGATGAVLPMATNTVVRNAGTQAGIWNLSDNGSRVFGVGYTFGSGGNLESSFSSDLDGNLVWVVGCLGDNYDVWAKADVAYTVGHTHNCSQVGSLPEQPTRAYQRAWAWSAGAGAHGETNLSGAFAGRPAPEQLHWLPTIDAGTYTGQSQGAWTVTGNDRYVVMGGEFPRVNFTNQQGLVRFAVKTIAPNKQGPTTPNQPVPTATAIGTGALRLTWQTSWDRDSQRLTYDVVRNGTVIGSVKADSTWWNRPNVSWVDTSYTPGGSATYQIRTRDTNGTQISGSSVNLTAPGTQQAAGGYADAVRADGAANYWRLGETSGTVGYDWTGGRDLALSNATRNVAGALAGTADPATSFAGGGFFGSASGGRTTTAQYAPEAFSTEAWFRTASNSGGKIIGFGDGNGTGDSSTADRQVYMSNDGTLTFGVLQSGGARTVSSTRSYNDNRWHQVTSTLGDDGMKLYVDGTLVAGRTDTTWAQQYAGYWKVGYDAVTAGFPNRPSQTKFVGAIDDVATYPQALSAAQVAQHAQLATGANQSPTAAFTSRPNQLVVALDGSSSKDPDGTIASYAWDFGDNTTGTGATPSKTYAAAGTYPVKLTVTDNSGNTGTVTQSVTVKQNQNPTATFTSSASELNASFDASGSADPDGTVASYAWDFGDNTTGTGARPTHAYAAGGSYTVTLTVTDNEGGRTTATRTLTVAANARIATDAFGRTTATGWGTADTGGAWTASGGTTSVAGGSGVISTGAGTTSTLRLAGAVTADTDLTHTVWTEALPTGGGVYWSDIARRTATGDYRAKIRVLATGAVQVQFSKVVGGTETALTAASTVSGLTLAANTPLNVRFQATGSAPTTLRVKLWAANAPEPTAWNQTTTDATAGLQDAGSVGFVAYTSGSATAPVVTHYDDLTVSRP